MLFNSLPFVLLMAVTMLLYYLPVRRRWWQGTILVAAGMVFYGYYSVWGLVLLMAVALVNGIAAWGIVRQGENRSKAKMMATVAVVADLVVLAFFKYIHLLEFTPIGQDDGIGAAMVHLALPLGISFYIFSAISLMIDTYKNTAFANRGGIQLIISML